MSSFRDTFTKEDKKENLLNYDDSAFFYFAGAVVLTTLVPVTYFFITSVLASFASSLPTPLRKFIRAKEGLPETTRAGSKLRYCQCSLCAAHIEKAWRMRHRSFADRIKTWTFWVRLLSILLGWTIFVLIVIRCTQEAPVQSFDPFAILGVAQGASDRDIKKAYRTMSLKLHPDKNPNDPLAASKFLQLAKAYAALTDELGKKNWEKYGNPDGPGTMKVGIGLPRFLLEEGNQVFILCLFFIFLLFIVPMGFLYYYHRAKKYHPSGILMDTVHLYGMATTEHVRAKNGPEMLAISLESRERPIKVTDDLDMKPLIEELADPKIKHFKNPSPAFVKSVYLIHAHLQRCHHLLSPSLMEDLHALLSVSMKLTYRLIETAVCGHWQATGTDLIEFRRCLVQAVEPRASPFFQLPHFDSNCVRHCQKAKNAPKDIPSFAALSPQDRRGVAELTDEQKLDIEEFLKVYPRPELTVTVTVEDETEICEGDIATVTARITRHHLNEGEAIGPIHAPHFPVLKQEEWFFFLSEKSSGTFLGYAHSRNAEREFQETMQFQVPPKKTHPKCTVVVHALCDAYLGCDKMAEATFGILTEAEAKRTIFTHPEDEALDDEPTLFQQFMGGATEEDSEDDEEDDPEYVAKQQQGKVGGVRATSAASSKADPPPSATSTTNASQSSRTHTNTTSASDIAGNENVRPNVAGKKGGAAQQATAQSKTSGAGGMESEAGKAKKEEVYQPEEEAEQSDEEISE